MHTRIKELITLLGLNQTSFAARLDVNRSYISRIVNSEQAVNKKIIRAICREFNVSEEWLRTGVGEPFLSNPESIVRETFTEKTVDDFVAATMALPKEFQDFIMQVGLALCEKRDASPLEDSTNPSADSGNSQQD